MESHKPLPQGFTLLEILLVLLLLATTASFVTVRLTSQADTLFLRKFLLTLQRARLEALSSNTTKRIFLLDYDTRYEQGDYPGEDPAILLEIPEEVTLQLPEGAGVDRTSDRNPTLQFYSDGSVLISGTDSKESITSLDILFDEARTYRFSFHPFSGIHCQRIFASVETES